MGGLEIYARSLTKNLLATSGNNRYVLVATEPTWTRHEFAEVECALIRGAPSRLRCIIPQTWIPFLKGVKRALPILQASHRARTGSALNALIRQQVFDVWFCPFIELQPSDLKVASVVVMPDIQHEFYPNFFPRQVRRARRSMYANSAMKATRVVTLSEYSRSLICSYYGLPGDRVLVVPPGVGEEFLEPQADQDRKIREAYALPKRYFFYPANIWPHKNHERLLSALAVFLRRVRTAWHLVLTGQDSQGMERVRVRARHSGLQESVLCLGYVPYAHLPAIYRGATALVFPSLFEGFGMPLLEAMTCGCPIVASRATSIPEVVGEAALFIDPLSEESIADGLERIVEDQNLRRMLISCGRSRARKFTWELAAQRATTSFEQARAAYGASS